MPRKIRIDWKSFAYDALHDKGAYMLAMWLIALVAIICFRLFDEMILVGKYGYTTVTKNDSTSDLGLAAALGAFLSSSYGLWIILKRHIRRT